MINNDKTMPCPEALILFVTVNGTWMRAAFLRVAADGLDSPYGNVIPLKTVSMTF